MKKVENSTPGAGQRGRMTIKPGQSAKCIEALKALHAPPLTDEEKAVYDQQRRDEMGRAEARRSAEGKGGNHA